MTVSAKVAKIMNIRQIAINAGSDAGVNLGDTVKIVDHTTINDPDTKEDLGTVQTTILELQVSMVAPKYALARTFKTIGNKYEQVTEDWSAADAVHTYVEVGYPVVVEQPPKVTSPAKPDDDLDDLPF